MSGSMSEEEICREFRLAASKTKQLQILADENVCTKKEIAEILIRNGEEGVPKWYTNPPKEKKQKDQTIKADEGKPELRLVPFQIVRDIAQVRSYGNAKYGDSDSWRRVEPERYIDAMLRHALAFAEDPRGVDEESGIEHYKHLACNVAFLCELMKGG